MCRAATRNIMNAGATYLIPDVSYEQAAPIFCAGYTVYSGLCWADPKPHERVAVLGIGGLGHLAVQYAKAAGFETIAVSRSPDKDKMIRDLAADEIVRDGKVLLHLQFSLCCEHVGPDVERRDAETVGNTVLTLS